MRDLPTRLDALESLAKDQASALRELANAVKAQEKLLQAVALMIGVPKTDTQHGMLSASYADDRADDVVEFAKQYAPVPRDGAA